MSTSSSDTKWRHHVVCHMTRTLGYGGNLGTESESAIFLWGSRKFVGRGCYCTFESDLAMGGGKLLFGGGCLIKVNLGEGVFQLFSVYFNVRNYRGGVKI